MSILQMKVLPKAEQNTVHWAWKKSDCWRKQMSVKTSNGKLNSQLSTEESWNQFGKTDYNNYFISFACSQQ